MCSLANDAELHRPILAVETVLRALALDLKPAVEAEEEAEEWHDLPDDVSAISPLTSDADSMTPRLRSPGTAIASEEAEDRGMRLRR